jgi:aryl-alcohol dehydrogenase-like predicted oxidoreductase
MKKEFIPLIDKYISPIGLGCVTFGREIDRETAFQMMDYALEHGITLFDTAASYGSGASEEIVGTWLRKNSPDSGNIIIATKVKPPYTRENILDSIYQSLNRLQLETIDVLFLHSWDQTVETSAALYVLNDLVIRGKVKALGVSNFNAKQLREVIKLQKVHGYSLFQFLQNNNNVAIRDVDTDIEQVCFSNNIKIVTYSPLGAGFLTGKYKNGIHASTRFDLVRGHQEIYFNEASLSRLERLEELSFRTSYPITLLALAWALHRPNIACVLIGGRSSKHLQQAFEAAAFNNAEIFNQLESI